jgi:hypothetical protein
VDWSTCICMVVFVKSAPSNCKVVLATSKRSRLNQVKSHNPSTTSQLVLICEDGVSFEHIHHTQLYSAQVLEENLLQPGVTSKRVSGLSLGISWSSGALLFLVKE